MKNCCRAGSCERFFKPSVARRSLETYQKKGLDQLERDLVSHIAPDARTAARVLEIGGGIGKEVQSVEHRVSDVRAQQQCVVVRLELLRSWMQLCVHSSWNFIPNRVDPQTKNTPDEHVLIPG